MNRTIVDNSVIRVECVRDLRQFLELEPAFHRIYQDAGNPNPFLSWEWLSAWVEVYRHQIELSVYLVYYLDELIGILPLYRSLPSQSSEPSQDCLRFIGDRYVSSEYLDLLAAPQNVTLVMRVLLTQVLLFHRHSTNLFLDDVAETSPLLSSLTRLSRKHGFLCSIRKKNVCPILDLQDSNPTAPGVKEQYRLGQAKLEQLHKKFANQIEFIPTGRDVRLAQQLEDLFALHQKNWQNRGANGSFTDDNKKQFYRTFAARFQERGWLNLFSLRIADQTVASFIGFTVKDVFYFLQSGTDPDWGKYSVGTATFYQILQTLKNRGVRWLDFLRGDEDYKYRWGAKPRYTYSIRIYPSTLATIPSFLLQQAKEKVKSFRQPEKGWRLK